MKKLFGLILGMLCGSCQEWSPSLERLQQQCGSNFPESRSDERIIQFLSPTGEALTAGESESVHVLFQNKANSSKNLPLSSKGCVSLPSESGTLIAQNSLRSWAVAENLPEKSLLDARFQELRFAEPKPFQVNLLCPEGGWLANDRLDSVLTFSGDINANLLDLHISARNLKAETTLLAKKNLGFALDGTFETFDLKPLVEGTYELQLQVRDLAKDWNPDVSTSFATCPLQVIRHLPDFKQESLPSEKIYALGTILNPEFIEASDHLFVCKEPGFSASLAPCAAQSDCRQESAFKEQALVKLDEKGGWTYHFFGRNRLGQKSKNTCTSVFVSDEAPSLKLAWKTQKWNEIHAVEKTLPPEMEAMINVKHSIVSGEDLIQNLSCKVEFIFRGISVFPGDKVKCLSDSCQGKTMGDFVACDSSLRFGIGEALQTEYLRDSEIRLTVKANDGAGHENLSSLSLWLQESQYQSLDFVELGPTLESVYRPQYFWYTNDGGMLVKNNGSYSDVRFYYLSSFLKWPFVDSWKKVTASKEDIPGTATSQSVVQTSDGRILGLWPSVQYFPDNTSVYSRIMMEFDKGVWKKLNFPGWDPLLDDCEVLYALDKGRAACLSKSHMITFNPDSTLEKTTAPARCDYGAPQLQMNAQGELYGFCSKDRSWRRNADQTWEALDYPVESGFHMSNFGFDTQGRPWLFGMDTANNQYPRGFLVRNGPLWEAVPLPETPGENRYTDNDSYTLTFDSEGHLRVADFVWNEATKVWKKIPEIAEWIGDGPLRVRNIPGTDHGLWYENSKFMLMLNKNERQIFPLKSLNWPSPDFASVPGMGPKGQLCMSFRSENNPLNIRCQISKNWSRLGRNYLNLPKDRIAYMGGTNESMPVVVTQHEGTFIWEGTSWNNVFPPPPVEFSKYSTTYFFDKRALWLMQDSKVYRITRESRVWEKVYDISKDAVSGVTDWQEFGFSDNLGNIWFTLRYNRLLKFDGKIWTQFDMPKGFRPEGIIPFADKLLVYAGISEGQPVPVRKELHWMDPQTFAFTKLDPAEFGWDSELLTDPTLMPSFIGGQDAFLLKLHNKDFHIKSQIFDLRNKRQITVDAYEDKRLWNVPINYFERLDKDRFLVVYPDMIYQRYGGNNQLFIIDDKAQKTRLFSDMDMKYVEENLDLRPAYWHCWLDGQGNLWLPAETFQHDVSDELFRVNLRDWIR